MNNTTEYQKQLIGLRALAVLGVLVFHLNEVWLPGGFLGVDVFFVLSGFLISRLIITQCRENSFSFVEFYIRRARRILPALFAVLLFGSLAAFFILGPIYFKAAAQSAFFAVFSMANFHFLTTTGYFNLANQTKPFLHLWSLGVEEQFYLLWPALLVLLIGFLTDRISVVIMALLFITSLAGQIFFFQDHPGAVFYLVIFRVWEFAAGCLLAITKLGNARLNFLDEILASSLSILGIALIVIAYVFHPIAEPSTNFQIVAVIGTVLVIVGETNRATRIVLENPISLFLGKISYSLYLWHWPVIVLATFLLGPVGHPITAFILSFASLILAYLTYQFIEQPLKKPWTKSFATERLAVPAALCAVALLIVLPTTLAWNQDGWSWRMSEELAEPLASASIKPRPNCTSREFELLEKSACVFGLKGDFIDIAVMGDSHAETVSAGLALNMLYADRTGIDVHGSASLPFVGTRVINSKLIDFPSLNDKFEAVLRIKPKYVVLHGRFAAYWTGLGSRTEPRFGPVYVGKIGNVVELNRKISQSHFISGLKDTIELIKASGSIPVIVGSIPEPGADVLLCFSNPFVRTIEDGVARCPLYSQKDALARIEPVNEILTQTASSTGALFYNPVPLFCKPNEPTCRITSGNNILYRDDDHLSDYGSKVLGRNVLNHILRHEKGEI